MNTPFPVRVTSRYGLAWRSLAALEHYWNLERERGCRSLVAAQREETSSAEIILLTVFAWLRAFEMRCPDV